MSKSETTTPPASENSLHRLLLDMKSDLMQHVQDCVSNAMRDFVRDDVPSESSDDLCDDHSNPRVSDEIEHFLAHNVGQYPGRDSGRSFWRPKRPCGRAEFSTNERTSSSIDDDLLKIIEGLINNKLPKEKIDGLTEKYPRPENCKLLVVPKTNRAVWNQLKDATKKADMGMQKCQKLFMTAMYAILEASRGACGTIKANLIHALVLILSGNRELNLKRRELLRPEGPVSRKSRKLFGPEKLLVKLRPA